MQSGEVDYTETAWQRFDSNITKEVISASSMPGFSLKINAGISRSIIVPILFVALIGSLSVLLFSFVDFKKKEEVATEVPLIITPPEVKKPEEKPQQIVTKTTPVNTVKDSVPVLTPTIQTAINNEPVKPVTETSAPAKETAGTAKVAATVKPVLREPQPEVKEQVVPRKKKKRRRMSSEELPSITMPVNLSSGSPEPELELK
jgi:hypothetical protein